MGFVPACAKTLGKCSAFCRACTSAQNADSIHVNAVLIKSHLSVLVRKFSLL